MVEKQNSLYFSRVIRVKRMTIVLTCIPNIHTRVLPGCVLQRKRPSIRLRFERDGNCSYKFCCWRLVDGFFYIEIFVFFLYISFVVQSSYIICITSKRSKYNIIQAIFVSKRSGISIKHTFNYYCYFLSCSFSLLSSPFDRSRAGLCCFDSLLLCVHA